MHKSPCAIVFFSIHNVLAAEEKIKKAKIAIMVIPVPKEISPDCGMALQFDLSDQEKILENLGDLRDKIKGIFRIDGRKFHLLERNE